MSIKCTEIFTPGAFPKYTYIERGEKKYEERLRDGLNTPGQVISLSGPSKSGKTVLVEKVVGSQELITITGASIQRPDDLWERVLDWMGTPSEKSVSNTLGGGIEVGVEGKVSGSIPLVASGEAGGKASGSVSKTKSDGRVFGRRGMAQVIDEIGGSDFVVLVDDFHYMRRDVQEEITKQIKEAVRREVKIITASVTHRSDDVVRANPELRGRVMAIDLEYWEAANLAAIGSRGFEQLRVNLDGESMAKFVSEAAGSPQLMQAICLNACFELGIRNTGQPEQELALGDDQSKGILERTASTADFRSLVDVLDSGPKTRGTERRIYKFKDGSSGDVYRSILKAISGDPPELSFPYDSILKRIRFVCTDEEPAGSSLIGSCLHMSKLAQDKFPSERVLDWDEQKQVLDITDPYLLFYLRWSGRLMEPEE